jgi:hypothetical protein
MFHDKEAEQARYHFTLSDVVEYMEIYGWDVVQEDLADYYHKMMFNRMHESEF